MARPKNPETLAPLTGGVTPGTREAVESYRWQNRMTVSQVVRQAVEEWCAKRDLKIVEPTEDAPAEDKSEDAPKPEQRSRR